MKKLSVLLLVMAAIFLFSCQKDDLFLTGENASDTELYSSQIVKGKYIIVFEDKGLLKSASLGGEVRPDAVRQTATDIFNVMNIPTREPDLIYNSAIRGVAISMSENEAARMATAPGVKGVYPDRIVTLKLPSIEGKPVVNPPIQSTPYGIIRVGGVINYKGSSKAWIIDTGIDLDHPDLNVNTDLAVTYVVRTSTADDDNGHGTHCAGIVGAINNAIGVVGVAPGASVVPVKVLNKRGSGYYSWIIAGVDYVAANAERGDAANLSLGGPADDELDLAIKGLAAKGIKIAIAAGNESDDAGNYSPSRVDADNVFTVSAMNSSDIWAYFSNYGASVDYCAPGISIYSTYKGGSYGSMSGTSMAAPHVCGILLTRQTPNGDGNVIEDPDGVPDPIAHL